MRSSRTYISELERKLTSEKIAREKLQKEVEELKRISSAISTQIGFGKGFNRN
jgi:predicted RNase H-like nuclease (RuvC/YqgF family)